MDSGNRVRDLQLGNQEKDPIMFKELVDFNDKPGEKNRASQHVGKPFRAEVAKWAISSRNTVGKSRPSGPPID